MSDLTIRCPRCDASIKLDESLAAPMVAQVRERYEKLLAQRDAQVAARAAQLAEQERELKQREGSLDEMVQQRLIAERARIAQDEQRRAKLALAEDLARRDREVAEMRELLKQRDEKLGEAQKAQAEAMRKERELADARRELDLTIEQRVQQALVAAREQAKREASEQLLLKVQEKDQTIASMQQKIEELKRRAEQGSQQLQGEALELELEAMLRARFPRDLIEPVPKGQHGGDIVHRVVAADGRVAGAILWETKRTKSWSDLWLAKLREDQRQAQAEHAVIVSHALPKEIESFDQREGVWVAQARVALPLAAALRGAVLQAAAARRAADGVQTKTEQVYAYLTGTRFQLHVRAVVEAFTTLRQELDAERKAFARIWSKREMQIERVLQATAGMYGDLQGIVGRSLQEIEGLGLPLLGADDPEATP